MPNRNVQLKLNDIWKKKQLSSVSSSSSSVHNVTSEITYRISGQSDSCQDDDIQGKGCEEEQGDGIQQKGAKRNLSVVNLKEICKKSKQSKKPTIKCANECRADISQEDPIKQGAIQCYHQSDRFNWIECKYSCSMWLCHDCQIELNIKTDSVWICSEHIHMHTDTDDDEDDMRSW